MHFFFVLSEAVLVLVLDRRPANQPESSEYKYHPADRVRVKKFHDRLNVSPTGGNSYGKGRIAYSRFTSHHSAEPVIVDRDRLQHLIDQHYGRIRRTALALCGDPWEADEIAQETFLAAIDAALAFRGDASEATWLHGICLRIHRSRLRSAIRRLRRGTAWLLGTGRADTAPRSDYPIERLQWQQSLWATVARLPPPQREVVVLRFIDGMSIADIAEVVGCSAGTVKSRLHHALGKLRGWLNDDSPAMDASPPSRDAAPEHPATSPVTRSSESLACIPPGLT